MKFDSKFPINNNSISNAMQQQTYKKPLRGQKMILTDTNMGQIQWIK